MLIVTHTAAAIRVIEAPISRRPFSHELGDSHIVETMSRRPEPIAECAHPLLAHSARGGSARQRADGEVSRDLRRHRPLRTQGTSPSRASRVPPLLSRAATGGDELRAAFRVSSLDRRDAGPIAPTSTCRAILCASPSSFEEGRQGVLLDVPPRMRRDRRAQRARVVSRDDDGAR